MGFRPYFLLLWACVLATTAQAGCPTEPWVLIGGKSPALKLLGAPPADVIVSKASERDTMSVDKFLKIPKLRFMTLNVANWYVGTTKDFTATGKKRPPADPSQKPKSEEEMAAVVRIIAKYKPDIISIQEMQDVHAFLELSRRTNEGGTGIANDYLPLLIEGNDGRGIDVGVLVRADFPLDYTYVSHRREPMTNPLYPQVQRAFTRDTTALVASVKGTNIPLFIVLSGHFKSKHSAGADFEGVGRRGAESEAAANVVQYYQALYPGVPIVFGADFNGAAHRDAEFAPLIRRAKLADAFDAIPDPKKRVAADDPRRKTYTYFPPGGGIVQNQLDGLLVNKAMAPFLQNVDSGSAIDARGRSLPRPTTLAEKDGNDHLPQFMDVDLPALRKSRELPEEPASPEIPVKPAKPSKAKAKATKPIKR